MISFYINLKFTHYNNTISYVSLLTSLIVYYNIYTLSSERSYHDSMKINSSVNSHYTLP